MLGVIDEQNDAFRSEHRDQGLDQRAPRLLGEVEGLRDCRQDQPRISQGGELYPIDPVRESLRSLRRRLQRESCLPDPSWPGQGHEPYVIAGQQVDDLGEFPLPTKKRCGGYGQVRPIKGFQWRKRPVSELVYTLGRGEILESVLAQIVESPFQLPRARLDQRSGRGGYEHLPAVSRRGNPGRSMHVEADVPLLRDERRPRVQSHSNPDRTGGQHLRRLGGTRERPKSRRECDEERVSLRVDLHPAVAGCCCSQHPPMFRQSGAISFRSQLAKQAGRPFHIREQESDGSRRRPTHRRNGFEGLLLGGIRCCLGATGVWRSQRTLDPRSAEYSPELARQVVRAGCFLTVSGSIQRTSPGCSCGPAEPTAATPAYVSGRRFRLGDSDVSSVPGEWSST